MLNELQYLFSPISKLKGFGEKTVAVYKRLLTSKRFLEKAAEPKIIDLIYHKPERILPRIKNPNLIGLLGGEFVILDLIVDTYEAPFRASQPHKIICHNETGFITLVFFKVFPNFIERNFKEGSKIRVSGNVERYNDGLQMSHPDYINVANIPEFETIYPLTAGLTNRYLRQSIHDVLENLPDLPEWLDDNFLFQHQWKSWKESILALHNAKSDAEIAENSPYVERLAFDEILANQIALGLMREKIKHKSNKKVLENKGNNLKDSFLKKLPFTLTGDQQKVIGEIEDDVYSSKRMLRLLQGDVGSGKTVVSFLTSLPFVENGRQVAIMVPTSILATQHYEWMSRMCEDELDCSKRSVANDISSINPIKPTLDFSVKSLNIHTNKLLQTTTHVKTFHTPPVKSLQTPPVKGGKGGSDTEAHNHNSTNHLAKSLPIFNISLTKNIVCKNELHLPYRKDLTKKAQELRKTMTTAERRFYKYVLKNEVFSEIKWNRQKPVGDYILDFYSAALRLNVEIDDLSHENKRGYDYARDRELKENYNIKTVRYLDDDVKNNIEGVFEDFRGVVEARVGEINSAIEGSDLYSNDADSGVLGGEGMVDFVGGDEVGCDGTPLTPLQNGGPERASKGGVERTSKTDSKIALGIESGTVSKTTLNSKTKPLRVELLTGKIKGKKREKILNDLKNGEIDILVGTHAIFQEKVEFKNLSYAVIDEQHRFGVSQRLSLIEKGDNIDILIMTATPIPRTLALTIYGDMDVSAIREKPKNRKEIITSSLVKERFTDLVDRIKNKINEGEKVYWICPLIEDDEAPIATPLFRRYEELKRIFGEETIGFIHGKLTEDEKDKIMADFSSKDGKIKILIATTVVEVGVDVPDATIIIIEDPDRFGLSQMHQLRGRVGRGDRQSYCILFYEKLTENLKRRLEILKSTSNGFDIAEEDLKLRGSGEALGVKQSGYQEYLMANLSSHYSLLLEASRMARDIVANRELLNSKPIQILLQMFGYGDCMNEAILN